MLFLVKITTDSTSEINQDYTVTMCGIFAYLNYGSPKTLQCILETLVNGLRRLEYRGYDSAGVAYSDDSNQVRIIKSRGKVQELSSEIFGTSPIIMTHF